MEEYFETSPQIKPEHILDILVRGKWLLVIPLCITLTIGIAKTLTANKIYEASTLILIQPQRVPTNYVQSVVTDNVNQRISTMSQQILSRSNLERIINQFGLYDNQKGMYLEDKIASMRKRIQIKLDRGRSSSKTFSISYRGSNPDRVMRIANTLAAYYMDENLRVREAQAVGTSEFLDSELEKTRKNLEEREQRLAAYRTKYMGGLPDELDSNLKTLDRLQKQLSDKNMELREARNAKAMIETQISQSREMLVQPFEDPFASSDFEDYNTLVDSMNENNLKVAQAQYDNLLLQYTEKHPDVVKIKKTIDKLTAIVEAERKAFKQKQQEELEKEKLQEEENSAPISTDQSNMEFTAVQQGSQLQNIKKLIETLKGDIKTIEEKMALYQQRVEDTPKRELELQSLKRDYANIQGVYHSLLDRKLEAELSVNMERKQKGEQFKILDHAQLPEKPISPNVKMLFLLSVASGLLFGGGVLSVKEIINFSVIRRDDQIENRLGLNVLAVIPVLKSSKDIMRQRIIQVFFVLCCLYAFSFLSFFVILNQKGIDRTIRFLYKIII